MIHRRLTELRARKARMLAANACVAKGDRMGLAALGYGFAQADALLEFDPVTRRRGFCTEQIAALTLQIADLEAQARTARPPAARRHEFRAGAIVLAVALCLPASARADMGPLVPMKNPPAYLCDQLAVTFRMELHLGNVIDRGPPGYAGPMRLRGDVERIEGLAMREVLTPSTMRDVPWVIACYARVKVAGSPMAAGTMVMQRLGMGASMAWVPAP
jgi:hypothetical protein